MVSIEKSLPSLNGFSKNGLFGKNFLEDLESARKARPATPIKKRGRKQWKTSIFKDIAKDIGKTRTDLTVREKLDEALNFIREHAPYDEDGNPKPVGDSIGHCSEYVFNALEAAGFGKLDASGNYVPITRDGDAKDNGPNLKKLGFTSVAYRPEGDNPDYPDYPEGYTPQAGDVMIVQDCQHHRHGHIAIFDGQYWISDFVQDGIWVSRYYRDSLPACEYFRLDIAPETVAGT